MTVFMGSGGAARTGGIDSRLRLRAASAGGKASAAERAMHIGACMRLVTEVRRRVCIGAILRWATLKYDL